MISQRRIDTVTDILQNIKHLGSSNLLEKWTERCNSEELQILWDTYPHQPVLRKRCEYLLSKRGVALRTAIPGEVSEPVF